MKKISGHVYKLNIFINEAGQKTCLNYMEENCKKKDDRKCVIL